MAGKFASRKFIIMLGGYLILVLVIILTFVYLPDNISAWGYLTMLTPFVFGLGGAYLGVQGYNDLKNNAKLPTDVGSTEGQDFRPTESEKREG